VIDARDRGFLLGDGVFETVLVFNRVALWLDAHLNRLGKAARRLGITYDVTVIEAAVAEKLARAGVDAHVLRISLSRGVTARGLAADGDQPTLIVTCDAFDTQLIGKPLSLITSSVRRNPASVSDRYKTLSYVNNVLAAREARERGADDALMLNIDGIVASASAANIFILNGKLLSTPAEEDGILAGVMRRFIMNHAASFGYSVDVRAIERDELARADAVFLTNSLRLVSPVLSLDGEDLKRGGLSDLTKAVLDAIQTQCGAAIKENVP
jgi:branched-chain amino acid aminotransferase